MSASRKSKGAGTVLLLVFLFLAIAGGSAWVIHTVLNSEEAPVAEGQSEPSGRETAATRVPGDTAPQSPDFPGGEGGAEQSPGRESATLPGGVVVESIPGGTAESGSGISGQTVAPPIMAREAAGWESGGEDTGQGSDSTPSGRLLVVPGAESSQTSSPGGDAVVRPAFVDDIALFLAQNYWPKGTHPAARKNGITTASLRWANLRYGTELRSLDGRQAVLHYVLNPGMVSKLYALYADPFIASLAREAETRVVGEAGAERFLSAAEKKEMFAIYSSYAARVADALERYAATPGMAAKVEAYAEASARVEEANKVYMESVVAYESSKDGNDNNPVAVARLKRDKEAATYQKRIREREAAYRALVTAMSGGKAGGENNDIVYVAFWAHRRGADAAPALKACAKALSDISARLSAEAKRL